MRKGLFLLIAVTSFWPALSAAHTLLAGILFANIAGSIWPEQRKTWMNYSLKTAVVLLAFGIAAQEAWQALEAGFIYTLLTITLALGAGWLLSKALGISGKQGSLISIGTAICGGSAIAAMAPLMKAKAEEISLSLAVVFILNAIALLTFPPIGNWLGLSQGAFGIWSALAIHDTSSVVGAASIYGSEALKTATTLKLARALWIIPLALGYTLINKSSGKLTFPWFILIYLVIIMLDLIFHWPAEVREVSHYLAKSLMKLSLFLVGNGLTLEVIRKTGTRSLSLGMLLWLLMIGASLALILF